MAPKNPAEDLSNKRKEVHQAAKNVSELEKHGKDATQAKGKLVSEIVDSYKELKAKTPASLNFNGKKVELQVKGNIKFLPGVEVKTDLTIPAAGNHYEIFQGLTQGNGLKKTLPNMEICGLSGDKKGLVVKDSNGLHILGDDGKMVQAHGAYAGGDKTKAAHAYFATKEEATAFEATLTSKSSVTRAVANADVNVDNVPDPIMDGTAVKPDLTVKFVSDHDDKRGRNWHADFSLTGIDAAGHKFNYDKLTVSKLTFTETNDQGSQTERTFIPVRGGRSGEMTCSTKVTKADGSCKTTERAGSERYRLNLDDDGTLTFTQLSGSAAGWNKQTYKEDGSHVIQRKVGTWGTQVTEVFPAQARAEGAENIPARVEFVGGYKYALTHKTSEGFRYTVMGDKTQSPKIYTWQYGQMVEDTSGNDATAL